MDILRFFDITADLVCLLLCIIELVALLIWYKLLDKSGKFFVGIFISCILSLSSNAIGLIFKGSTVSYAHNLLVASNFCEFAAGILLAFVFTMYFLQSIELGGNIQIHFRKWIVIYCVITLTMLIISQFSDLYYYIDASNYYHRGSYFFISQIFGIGLMIFDLVLLVIYKDYLHKREIIAILIYIFLPALALILQIFIYGVYLLLLAETISITIMFLLMLSEQVRNYYEKDKQVSEMKMRLTLSQIQPHFLYNSLTAIKYLCKTDPAEAANSIEAFSCYLRNNMNAINTEHCIPFTDEISHVKNYIHLEEKRFGKRLIVNYNINATEFALPPLSIQPIVENAVKYGTMHNIDGVTININVFSDNDNNFNIIVSDNGPGFNPDTYNNDGELHVGIASVKSRLASMCGGALIINSFPGKGTEVVISIPAKHNNDHFQRSNT